MKHKSAGDLVDLIIQQAYQIMNWNFIDITQQEIGSTKEAKGLPKGYHGFDKKKLNEIVELAKPLIKESQIVKKIEVQNAKDVIDMVKKGKVSPSDGISLINLEKAKIDVEDRKQQSKVKKEIMNTLLKELDEEDED